MVYIICLTFCRSVVYMFYFCIVFELLFCKYTIFSGISGQRREVVCSLYIVNCTLKLKPAEMHKINLV